MSNAWGDSWGSSWGVSWGAAATASVVVDKGAGSGRKKKTPAEWRVVPLDEWLDLHHPVESVEKQTEKIEALTERAAEAPPPPDVGRELVGRIAREQALLDDLIEETKREAARTRKLEEVAAFIHEAIDYREALKQAKAVLAMAARGMAIKQRALRELDDEETLLTIIYHA